MKALSLIESRFKKGGSEKMAGLARRAQEGELSSFSGFFKMHDLSSQERDHLQEALLPFWEGEEKSPQFQQDLQTLIQITSEIKAISHQSALLHGERIAKAQEILTSYREGAFSAWLINAYGNRQTPYNLLLFYSFFQMLPPPIKPKAESMSRQAIYTLAARNAKISEKIDFIDRFYSETKETLLERIRELFPLDSQDRRRESPSSKAALHIEKAIKALGRVEILPSHEKKKIKSLLEKLNSMVSPLL